MTKNEMLRWKMRAAWPADGWLAGRCGWYPREDVFKAKEWLRNLRAIKAIKESKKTETADEPFAGRF
jgi:hypothetical protein